MKIHFLALAALALFTACFGVLQAAPAPGMRAAPVKVEEAKLVQLAPLSWVAGTVVSRNQARLAVEVQGRLTEVVEVGTHVEAGDVVARIDPTFVTIRIDEYQAAVQRDEARLVFLKGEVQRLESLAKQNNASQTVLDQTRANREVVRNEIIMARSRLHQAQEELQRHELRASFDGVIEARFMQAGEWAKAGDTVVQLIDSRALEVQARVPLETLDFVREGDRLQLSVAGRPAEGRVRALVAAGDVRSRLLEMRVLLDSNGWTIGQAVRVALPTAAAKEVLAVPRDALVLRRGGATLYRIDAENKAERVEVRLGVASGPLVEVIGDLKPGDRVVTRGGERLRPGADVQILDGV